MLKRNGKVANRDEEMEALTRQFETEQKMTPQQAHDRAWEIIREKYILLPPDESKA